MEQIKKLSPEEVKDLLKSKGIDKKRIDGFGFERIQVPTEGIFSEVDVLEAEIGGELRQFPVIKVVNDNGENIGYASWSRLFQGVCKKKGDVVEVFQIANANSEYVGQYMPKTTRLNDHLSAFGNSDIAIASNLVGHKYTTKLKKDQPIPNLNDLSCINESKEHAESMTTGWIPKDLHYFEIGEEVS